MIRAPRRALAALATATATATAVTLLAGCAAAPVPATVWLRLGVELPAGAPAPAMAEAPREAWQLMLPVGMPAHLERDNLFVPVDAGGALVRPLAGARWIEPLRDAVPRVLRQDLAREMRTAGLGALWIAPLPAGLVPARQLRVEIVTLEIGAGGHALDTRARWSVADASGARPPALHEAAFMTPAAAGGDPAAWAAAHRQAVAALAARIAATLAAPR
jgi:hypothetical protein